MSLIPFKHFVFKGGRFGIDRANMPQIKTDDIPEFLDWVKKQGVKVTKEQAIVTTLKPTQDDMNQEKIQHLIDTGKYKNGTVLVAKDNNILDGHHRWGAVFQATGGSGKIDFTRIHENIAECIALAHRFPKSFRKEIHEGKSCF